MASRKPRPCPESFKRQAVEQVSMRGLPLWKETRTALDAWLRRRDPEGDAALFRNRSSRAMTRSGFEYTLARHVKTAAKTGPGIAE